MVKVVYPLKQGLKHGPCIVSTFSFTLVKVVYPLKQGLKQSGFSFFAINSNVKVVYPLKQGLKLFKYCHLFYCT